MNACFIVLLLLFTTTCFAQDSAKNIQIKKDPPAVDKTPAVFFDKKQAPLNCNSPYKLEVSENLHETTDEITRDVKIVQKGRVRKNINMPTGREINGSSRAWKTKDGFRISLEWGSRYYWRKEFNFICRGNEFYLTGIKTDTFDKANPEKWTGKQRKIRPGVALKKFEIRDYIKTTF